MALWCNQPHVLQKCMGHFDFHSTVLTSNLLLLLLIPDLKNSTYIRSLVSTSSNMLSRRSRRQVRRQQGTIRRQQQQLQAHRQQLQWQQQQISQLTTVAGMVNSTLRTIIAAVVSHRTSIVSHRTELHSTLQTLTAAVAAHRTEQIDYAWLLYQETVILHNMQQLINNVQLDTQLQQQRLYDLNLLVQRLENFFL